MNYSYLESRRYRRKLHIRHMVEGGLVSDEILLCLITNESATRELGSVSREVEDELEREFLCDFRDIFPDDLYSF